MGGGLMQLVAYGAQDIYLTGNPQIILQGCLPQTHQLLRWNLLNRPSTVPLDKVNRVTSTISRNGDLVYRLFYEIEKTYATPTLSLSLITLVPRL